MHGTVMMFLFAVPIVEAMAVYLLPGMLGARDLPFPRLSAYAFWAYAIGGLAFFCTIFFGASPDGGWFMYPPLTSKEFSPGRGADWWLLGIGFIEISAIAGAIELIIGILFTRAPGMSLMRMPVFAWAMLVSALMIVFAFPGGDRGHLLLELERAFDWPFFIPARGGDPLLWQHLFWFFGHPEVYIIFLPAAGMVSMMVPTLARTPLVGYRAMVAGAGRRGVRSASCCGRTTCSPRAWAPLALLLVSAASFAVAIPSGGAGVRLDRHLLARPRALTAHAVPAGLSFHLRAGRAHRRDGGGAALRLAGARQLLHRGAPALRADRRHGVPGVRRLLLLGAGVQRPPAFRACRPLGVRADVRRLQPRVLPDAHRGLMGMPRRVYTYAADLGWNGLNCCRPSAPSCSRRACCCSSSTLVRTCAARAADHGNPWGAGTLEWLPRATTACAASRRSIRSIRCGASPLPARGRGRPALAAGHRLRRPRDAGHQHARCAPAAPAAPADRWLAPFVAAVGTAGFFLLLTVAGGARLRVRAARVPALRWPLASSFC
jgi:cytochrome c oxidase subunit I+III